MSKKADVDALLVRFIAGEDVSEILDDAIAEGVEDSGADLYFVAFEPSRQYGTGYNPPTIHKGMYVIVRPKKSIRIVGKYVGRIYDRTYYVGDNAEYKSYNYGWFGPIESISKSYVSIKVDDSSRNTRLNFYRFTTHNYDFDAARELQRQRDHMD